MKFNELEISKEIIEAVDDLGFEEMTEIQEKSIPAILENRDVIGKSNTGTGKTAAFGIPVIEKINEENAENVAVLILCPTRELSMQVCEELKKFSKYKKNVKITAVYGGASIEPQIKALKRGVNIVCGTPGRVLDHIRRRTLKLDNLETLVLDEADEMLNMGFREDIEAVLEKTPEQRQVVLFSATMPPAILAITNKYQNDPLKIEIKSKYKTVDLIKQYYVNVAMGRKTDALHILLVSENPKSSMIFCNTKKMADDLTTELLKRGFRAAGLHGDMKQTQRTQVMESFKKGTVSILIATDIAARGIDIDNVEIVFNYDIPQDYEYYIHRIGRTGRAGKEGKAYSFVCGRKQLMQLDDISAYIKADINEAMLPDRKKVTDMKCAEVFDEISAENTDSSDEKYIQLAEKICFEKEISMSQLAGMLIRDRILPEIKNVPDLSGTRPIRGRNSKHKGEKTVKLEINIGRNRRIAPNFVLGALVEATGLKGGNFGKIDIFDKYTTVEIPESEANFILESMQNEKIKDNDIKVKLSSQDGRNEKGSTRERNNKSHDRKKDNFKRDFSKSHDRHSGRNKDRRNSEKFGGRKGRERHGRRKG
ncbi:MAG: DEAD/DEAH box helicase [Oscillospiraceae bacterium]|nr:DEAD/DEAH box helicase [Oscillospiraceae bacterium]